MIWIGVRFLFDLLTIELQWAILAVHSLGTDSKCPRYSVLSLFIVRYNEQCGRDTIDLIIAVDAAGDEIVLCCAVNERIFLSSS